MGNLVARVFHVEGWGLLEAHGPIAAEADVLHPSVEEVSGWVRTGAVFVYVRLGALAMRANVVDVVGVSDAIIREWSEESRRSRLRIVAHAVRM